MTAHRLQNTIKSIKVRAYSLVVDTKKDESLEEVSPDEFHTTKFGLEHREDGHYDLVSRTTTPAPTTAFSDTNAAQVEFKMIYDVATKTYILMRAMTSIGAYVADEEGLKLNRTIAESTEEAASRPETDDFYVKPTKMKMLTIEHARIDPNLLESEIFSVRVPEADQTIWKTNLENYTLLEPKHIDQHRDYGSSYILPVLSSVNYDNTSAPVAFSDIPVNVAVAFNILYLANFDSELMEFSSDIEMEFTWFDIRLVNNYTKPIRIREKEVIEKIWRPDPYIVNSKYSYFHVVSFPNMRIRITPQGLVTYTIRVSSVCNCFMSFCLYPHDKQICDLRISSIAYSNKIVNFRWHTTPIRFEGRISLPELHITQIETESCAVEGKLLNSSCLRVVLWLERDSARFVVEKYIPSTLAMMFAWVAPYVPYNYEDVRIVTPITVLLALVQMEKGNKEIRTSYLTSIDVWFAAMKAFTVLSLLESLIVLSLIKRSRAMTKTAQKAANELERQTFEAEAHRLDKMHLRLDRVSRVGSPLGLICFITYYSLFIAQGDAQCTQE